MPNRLLTTGELARELNVDPRTILRWITRYGIEPTLVTAGGHKRWDLEDVKRQLRELQKRQDR